MNIFADLHHSGLYYSFHLTFEKRFGFNLFRPIGRQWFDKGFFKIAAPYNNNPATIAQYLDLRNIPQDGTPALNSDVIVEKGQIKVWDSYHEYYQKVITFEEFCSMEIDIIIASIPAHYTAFEILRKNYKPKAKLIFHLSNIFWENEELIKKGAVKNLMASVIPFEIPKGINAVFYHQEQPVIPFSAPSERVYEEKQINSFVHLLPMRSLYEELKKSLPEFNFHAYGASCPDGFMPTLSDLYKKMADSYFIYHVKPHGDGYGWNWHSSFMVGRPLITNYEDYRGKLGGKLFDNLETGVSGNSHLIEEFVKNIRKALDPEIHLLWSFNARKNWEREVNYAKEAEEIYKFISSTEVMNR